VDARSVRPCGSCKPGADRQLPCMRMSVPCTRSSQHIRAAIISVLDRVMCATWGQHQWYVMISCSALRCGVLIQGLHCGCIAQGHQC
jgi:hypothetical protein